MKSTVEPMEPTKVKLTVEVGYDELKPHIDRAYREIAKQITIPGFRKGKVPAQIINQRIGWGAVAEEATNHGLREFYTEAVAANSLRPLAPPDVEVTELPTAPGKGQLVFVADVVVRPAVTLPGLDTIKLTIPKAEVSQADVDERLDLLRERFGTLIGVDRPARKGDYVVIDLTAKIDDDEVDSVAGISYQIGAGNMLAGIDEALDGLSEGESTTFRSELAGGDHAGEEANVTVTVTGVKERDLPEADDEFAQMASEFDTLAELLTDIREQLSKVQAGQTASQAREALVKHLVGATEVPVPAEVVEAQVKRHLEDEDRLTDDGHRAEVTDQTAQSLREQIVLDNLAEQLAVRVTQDELVNYLMQASQMYGMEPQQFMDAVAQAGQMSAMIADVARQKATALALRRVVVVDDSGAPVDLTPFIGSDEADAASVAVQEALAKAQAADVVDDSADTPQIGLADPTAIPDF